MHFRGEAGRAWGVLENMTSTGKVRPGMLNTGTPPKKLANLVLSSVALVTTRWKSRRRATTCACHKPFKPFPKNPGAWVVEHA